MSSRELRRPPAQPRVAADNRGRSAGFARLSLPLAAERWYVSRTVVSGRPSHYQRGRVASSGAALFLVLSCGHAQPDTTATASANRVQELQPLASNAPHDRVVRGADANTDPVFQKLVADARSELPAVRERFLKGLPQGEHLFVTTTIRSMNRREQVFVSVRDWSDPDVVEGLLAVTPATPGFHPGDVLRVAGADIVDWTISRPDGSEEGNRTGRYLEERR